MSCTPICAVMSQRVWRRRHSSARDSALRGSLAMTGRMSAETEHGAGLLDSDELQSLTPLPPGFAPAPLRHDGGAAMPSARDSGSSDRTAAEQGRRGSDADSVLGNAVQHDLDAFSAVSLPPLPLPAPDHERMATEPHQIASPMAGASTVDTHTHSRAPPVHNQQKRTWPRGGIGGRPAAATQSVQHSQRPLTPGGSRIPSAGASPARGRAATTVAAGPAGAADPRPLVLTRRPHRRKEA